jgi:hypothetical protein
MYYLDRMMDECMQEQIYSINQEGIESEEDLGKYITAIKPKQT